jgi:hypothetical protein
MRRAKAHFARLEIAVQEKSGIFYFDRGVRFALSTGRVWFQGQPAYSRRFRFLHGVLWAG